MVSNFRHITINRSIEILISNEQVNKRTSSYSWPFFQLSFYIFLATGILSGGYTFCMLHKADSI